MQIFQEHERTLQVTRLQLQARCDDLVIQCDRLYEEMIAKNNQKIAALELLSEENKDLYERVYKIFNS